MFDVQITEFTGLQLGAVTTPVIMPGTFRVMSPRKLVCFSLCQETVMGDPQGFYRLFVQKLHQTPANHQIHPSQPCHVVWES